MTDPKPTTDIRIALWLRRILYPLARFLVLPAYFGKIEIEGREFIPNEGPAIVAPTHRSRWDGILVPFTVGRFAGDRGPYFMISANETKGLQGWFMRRMGGFPVDPENPGLSSIRTSVELLENDKMLTVFPEGNIFRTPEVQPLKPGVARIALQAQGHRKADAPSVKILPVSMQYSQTYPRRGCQVRIRIGEPIDTAAYDVRTPKTAAKQLAQDLKAALDTLSGTATAAANPLESAA